MLLFNFGSHQDLFSEELQKAAQYPTVCRLPKAWQDIVKKAVKSAGLDPTRFAGHSLRIELVTTAGEKTRQYQR